jgi:hypothetical protein
MNNLVGPEMCNCDETCKNFASLLQEELDPSCSSDGDDEC